MQQIKAVTRVNNNLLLGTLLLKLLLFAHILCPYRQMFCFVRVWQNKLGANAFIYSKLGRDSGPYYPPQTSLCCNVYVDILSTSLSLHHRNRTELTPENLKHLENVFRENLAKDKDEFTLYEFKKIVPSKNVNMLFYFLRWRQLTYLFASKMPICANTKLDT